jgi:LysM repeat protein
MNGRRLIVYILLNVFVSAAVTLTVLWVWDRTHPTTTGTPALTFTATPPAPAVSLNTPLPPTDGPAPDTAAGAEGAPTATLYVVQRGDSLGRIAEQFDVTLQALMDANGLSDPNVISAGQSLIIPVEGAVPPTADPGAAPTEAAVIEPPRPTATRDPAVAQPKLTIREVQAAGELADERLVIFNSGGPVDLLGWSLQDENGHAYSFPSLMLFEGGAITIHTAPGTDTVTDLYWGQAQAVWAAGEQVLLNDSAGNLHTKFSVP